tara:strand:+ start:492 stop:605 length:114 start_codon:yes stop_codon:yes gene_type:complete
MVLKDLPTRFRLREGWVVDDFEKLVRKVCTNGSIFYY